MSTYEAWRITYQSSEAAARAAYNTVEKLHEENQALRKYVDGLRAALGAQVRFGSEGFLAAIEKLPRYTYNYASEDGKFLLRDEVLAAIASQARQATPTADMGNTTSQPPSATEAGNPASGAQDKMSTTQQPAALRLADKYEVDGFLGDHRFAQNEWCRQAVAELRRLHAENQDLRTRHYCNTAEIESLRARVQELGEMARENRSKRIVELEGRIAEMESEAEQNAKIIGASAETELALRARIAEMEAQMAAIGAGGVESLRKRAEAHDLAARQREMQLLGEIEALERLALGYLKQRGSESTPIAWYVTGCHTLLDEHSAKEEAKRCGGSAKAVPLYTHPAEGVTTQAKHGEQAVTMPAAQGLDAQTIKHISALSELVRTPNAEYFADAHNAAVRHLRVLAAQAKQRGKA